jgi:hypothetical protein
MSDHEGDLKHRQENSFIVLDESIIALEEYTKVFLNERQKFNQKTYEDRLKNVKEARSDCEAACKAYLDHLEANVKMHRKKISNP